MALVIMDLRWDTSVEAVEFPIRKVAAVDMRAETLKETQKMAEAIGAKVSTHLLDVSDLVAVAALPASVKKELGEVDALINNAGIIQPFVKVNELTMELPRGCFYSTWTCRQT